MAPQGLRELLDVAAAVGPEEADLLHHLADHLPVLADLACADLALLGLCREPGRLVVLADGRPTACRSLYGKARAGEIVAAEADPVAARCLRSGRSHRRPFVVLTSGSPVEQVVLPVVSPSGPASAALSVERSLLQGRWARATRPLQRAAAELSSNLLRGALRPGDVALLLRMAHGLTLCEPGGDLLYADPAARRLWQQAQPGGYLTDRLPSGPPPKSMLLSEDTAPWGREWQFQVGPTIFRRRDLPLGPGDPHSNLLALIQDVSHLHTGELLVSARSAAVQEVHHRVKNNLQTISSLLRMQARRETSPHAIESLRTAISRVLSVAFVHEALSRDGADEVDLPSLATTLVEAALHGAQRDGPALTYAVLGPPLVLPAARASQVALVLNELIQNAVKHAFPSGRPGTITVRFDAAPEGLTMTVRDDGVGLPPDFDLLKAASLGLQITKRIVESDLEGTLDISGNGGTTVTIKAPALPAHPEVG